MQKTTKASTASKKVVAAKTQQRATARQAPQMISPGERVRLPLRIHNRFAGYDPRLLREDAPSRQIDGLVLSIREIATGKLVPLASGDFGQYVVEVLHIRSFDASFASIQNAGKATMGMRPQNTPAWAKVKALLTKMGAERKLVSMADGTINTGPLAELLDGWRVVKVKADQLEVPE